MKIFCVGRNYGAHARELGNAVPEEPVIFTKPDTAILRNGDPFYLPDFSNDIHHEVELVVRIKKNGKSIPEKFAASYYDEIGLGIDFTARDLQSTLKSKGLPWDLAKGFDGSAPLGQFIPVADLDKDNIRFGLKKNGSWVQEGSSNQMLFSIDAIIHFISRYFTLRTGDLIFTGTPSGVGPVQPGDVLEGYLMDQPALHCEVK